ncbi:MAG: S9 family peptidase, partial [Verrucomicrobiae bacterium]|nr:S9 family peptidase [Verrucomicrobiae bacterium]
MKTLRTTLLPLGAALLLAGCAGEPRTARITVSPSIYASMHDAPDPHLWLEDVTGERALDWVRAQNALSTRELEASSEFEATRRRLLAIYDSKERIPFVSKHGELYYNFWRDPAHVRGVWRRTTLEEFRKPEPAWETVLDLDQLAGAEKENWVWKGASVLEPDHDRCLVVLSRGGADASVYREFDLKAKAFVRDGFTLPEAKSRVDWRHRDALYVGTDFGPGSLTDSGYPRVVKEWRRGTPLAEAAVVFEGRKEDVSVGASAYLDHGRVYEFVQRAPTFFTSETHVRRGDGFVRLDKPDDAEVGTFGPWLLLELRTDWTVNGVTHRAGSLLAADFDAYLRGERDLTPLFTPTDRKSLAGYTATKSALILTELENVRSRPYVVTFTDGKWTRTPLDAPEFGNIGVSGVDAEASDEFFMTVTDFLTPSSLALGTVGRDGRETLKSQPAFFKADGLQIQQFEARSRDGT